MFGAGGGTNSYREIEETEVILLWGSNARETHPIFFHHLLKGIHNGARLYAIDPRRTSSARWADAWLGLDVGSDIALANAVGREIIAAGLENREFIEHATTGFESYRQAVEPYTLAYAERETGVPARTIREMAHAYARADRAMICWTLGITEHHNAVDNVLRADQPGAADRARGPLRLRPQPAARAEQRPGRRRHGGAARPAPRLPARRGRRVPGEVRAALGRHRSRRDAAGTCRRCSRRWNGASSGPSTCSARTRSSRRPTRPRPGIGSRASTSSIVQDIFLTATAEMADVVFPAAAGWCESDGTVTNSERRVQRVRKALDPPAGARDDVAHPLRPRAPDGTRLGRAGCREHLGRGARPQSRLTRG